jgi:DNA-binding GntR family transcriptional regulator
MTTRHKRAAVAVHEIRSQTLVAVVQDELERQILRGELAPGQRLSEQAIATALSVSRGPVREACRALADIGLVTLVPSRGAFVKQLTEEDAYEVYDLRAGMVGLSASLLSTRLTPQVGAELDEHVRGMEQAAKAEDFARFSRLNLDFHDCIVSATANARLLKIYRSLVKEFQLFRVHALVQRDGLVQSNEEHREIVRALRKGDPAAAFRASFEHVQHGKERMLHTLRAREQQADATRARTRSSASPVNAENR